jgi:NAD(P)-dependent dehydrogenase (short-subunit alcohol dehydrogenase family)
MEESEGGRIALVTGGNRGIGFEVCRQLARQGIRVVLAARDAAKGEAAAATLRQEGLDVAFRQLDVTDRASVAALGSFVADEFGHLDILVNNAGVSLNGFNADVAQRTMAVNLFGAMGVTDALLPHLRGGGRIVMVSSGMGALSCLSAALQARFAEPELTREGLEALIRSFIDDAEAGRGRARGWPANAYRVSKVGLNAFTRILARELTGTDLCVNAVCPGWVRTDMGGPGASRSAEEGAEGIVWAATLPEAAPSGKIFRDRRAIAW